MSFSISVKQLSDAYRVFSGGMKTHTKNNFDSRDFTSNCCLVEVQFSVDVRTVHHVHKSDHIQALLVHPVAANI